jgi:DHA2 family multidrug resistance protein
MLGPLLGPTVGGWLTDAQTWRWVFLINVPFGLLAFVGMAAFLPRTRRAETARFDVMGFATLSIFLASLQVMLDRGQQLDWFSSREICIEATVAAAFAYITVVHMLTARNPFIEFSIFRDWNFLFGSIISMLLGVIIFGVMPLMMEMLQQVLGYPVFLTGLVTSPRGIGTVFSLMLAARLIGKVDSRYLVVAGLLCCSMGFYTMSRLSLQADETPIIVTSLIQGIGSGILFVPLSVLVYSTLDQRLRNEGAALYALTRNVGASAGISLLQALTIRDAATIQSRLVEGVRPDQQLLQLRMPDLDFDIPASLAGVQNEIVRQATMVAYVDTYRLLLILSLLIVPAVLLMRVSGKPAEAGILPAAE